MTSSDRPATITVSVLAACDDVARDAAVAGILLDRPAAAVLRYDHAWQVDGAGPGRGQPDPDTDRLVVRRRVITAGGVRWDDVIASGGCACCLLRDDLVLTLQLVTGTGDWPEVVVVPPLAAPVAPVADQLTRAIAADDLPDVRLGAVLAVVDVATAVETVLGDALLAELGRELSTHDRRALGEAAVEQVEYADLVVGVNGGDATATGLLRHLAPGRWAGDWTGLDPDALVRPHDLHGARARTDPLRVGRRSGALSFRPLGVALGVDGVGTVDPLGDGRVWTLDLVDPRPFHPERLLSRIGELGSGRLRGRGHFWLPTRPDTPCAWNGSGGQLAVGALPSWSGTPRGTHLVLTGTDPADRDRVAAAFAELLVTAAELAEAGAWVGVRDGFEPWLGERLDRAA